MGFDRTLWPGVLMVAPAMLVISLLHSSRAQNAAPAFDVKAGYAKSEHQIPMRDGKKLYTVVYAPKDTSQKYPILMQRTPYSAGPYGPDRYKPSIGPSPLFAQEGYIIVYQDVRGTFLSEGDFEDVRPHVPNKKTSNDIDESSDTYDTIEWLVKNVPNNNGRVGMWGISYPGFYVATALEDPHPALKAASPQAPIADWFIGDDDHHNGAFFILDSFGFNQFFGMPRPQPTEHQFRNFDFGVPDAYRFFLELGPVANAQNYFKGENKYWNDVNAHGTYDEFWQARNVLPHLKKVTPAVMTVGGWFDAEDLYGPLHIYQTIEKNNPKAYNVLVMGPWCHGCWAGGPGERLGNISFGQPASAWYRENVELPFFNYYLKDKGELKQPEALVFRTGANEWKSFDQWPPKDAQARNLYFHANGKLSFDPPTATTASFDEYLSDPNKPVPYTNTISIQRGTTYMIEDQRFAARRPDVLVYESAALAEDTTLAGPVTADLIISTTGTDADFIVKLIDVYPDGAAGNSPEDQDAKMGGFQMLVRGEVMRAKFRNSFSKPEPLVPNKPTEVKFALQDVHHTFKAGHKIMVQVQSSWFPLVDRNPQKFVDIYHATEADFQKATHRVYHSAKLSSHLKVGVLK
ncbi:MAG TPA: CocE/NonD family hydrolase [Blastocatellia bacterium]|nr:CocE/NonD family hydrolase [Blastocatellia bacterium]